MQSNVRFGISNTLELSWVRFKKQAWELIGMGFLYLASTLLPFVLAALTLEHSTAIAFLLFLVGIVASTAMSLGLLNVSLKVVDDKPWDWQELYRHFSRFIPYLGASILFVLIAFGGMLLFILPGIYWTYRFSQYPFFVTEGQNAVDALRSSWALTRGSFWDLLSYQLGMGYVAMLAMLPLLLGLFIFVPLQFIANAHVYRQMQSHPNPAPTT